MMIRGWVGWGGREWWKLDPSAGSHFLSHSGAWHSLFGMCQALGFLKLTGSQGTQGAHIPAFHGDLSTPANVWLIYLYWGPLRAFLVPQMVKNLPAVREVSISGSGRSPGEGNGNPCQYSCLENAVDRGAWRATVHVMAKKSDTAEQLTLSMCQALLWAPQDSDEPLLHDDGVFWKDTC